MNGSKDETNYLSMANAIRFLSMDAVQKANSGHPGMPMGMADVATVLFAEALTFDPSDPSWPNRDRFVLSAGHGSMLLYSLLYLTGYPGMDLEELKNFRQLGSKTAGHPEYGHAAGIETTTGPLGQGLGNAVGMALAERILSARHGSDFINHYTYVIAGDGCLMEGISQEAISLAGHLKLGKLIVLWDDNSISIDGPTSLSVSDNQLKRFEASGWNTKAINGHNYSEISEALSHAKKNSDSPWLIACRTLIGYGAPNKQGTKDCHGSPLGSEEIEKTRQALRWPDPPFVVPPNILELWRKVGQKGHQLSSNWRSKSGILKKSDHSIHIDDKTLIDAIENTKRSFASDKTKRASRVWSQMTLENIIPAVPELIGGSADLTPSNGTKTSHYKPISAADFSGNYIHFGVREHCMASAMNGIALHGGLIPFGATFLVFTDYCRPSIRLSALMKVRVIYVMTHDSIGVGEDGPTHQPVEHLASLRAIPDLNVLRPADALETAECWHIALSSPSRPSLIALTRDAVPTMLRAAPIEENLTARGAYLVTKSGKRDVTFLATGSEVALAVEAAATLSQEGINAAVVSMPSFELFREQTEAYKKEILGEVPRIGIEAGVIQGWQEWLRSEDRFIGMSSFGASAPAKKLYEYFGLTPSKICEAAKSLL
ncbi:MAG: transketolase [Hyphomicrobium sp.]